MLLKSMKLTNFRQFKETQSIEFSTDSEKNVFISDNTFFTLLPKTGAAITVPVEITYYVTTEDAYLKLGYSRVKNVIKKNVEFANGFEAGKAYTIKLILGLTSVKLVATVDTWTEVTASTVDLPINH